MSRIKISLDETEKLAGEISSVLSYASSLQEIARTIKPAVEHRSCMNVMREDVVEVFDAQLILAQAPEREGDYFVVPKIIKHD
jgi:aspartyl-tRNA(Asn)/glutamyl-tRNA(Gln) amidotransferase subunit C